MNTDNAPLSHSNDLTLQLAVLGWKWIMEWICINKPDFAKSFRVNSVAYLIEILFLNLVVVIGTSGFYLVDENDLFCKWVLFYCLFMFGKNFKDFIKFQDCFH